jgi:hypothetical protein
LHILDHPHSLPWSDLVDLYHPNLVDPYPQHAQSPASIYHGQFPGQAGTRAPRFAVDLSYSHGLFLVQTLLASIAEN